MKARYYLKLENGDSIQVHPKNKAKTVAEIMEKKSLIFRMEQTADYFEKLVRTNTIINTLNMLAIKCEIVKGEHSFI